MIKMLIGGSPCTYWSIAQKANREVEAEGLGWELFRNYLIAKEKFKPDFFLYENNKSAAQAIKDQISRELGVDLMHINSSLVSAQNRQRFYAFNWEVEQPEDRRILLKDILETAFLYGEGDMDPAAVDLQVVGRKKNEEGIYERSWEARIDGKSSALTTVDSRRMVAEPVGVVYQKRNGEEKPVYEVKDRRIKIKSKTYPIKLPDGLYIIRKLTPIECERLQTLPDNYTAAISNTQRYKGLGNGWTAEVIIHILKGALKDVPRDEEIVVLSMYDGIGTRRYYLEKMGFTNVTYYAYEIDEPVMKVALSNYPDIIELGNAFDLRSDDWELGKKLEKEPEQMSNASPSAKTFNVIQQLKQLAEERKKLAATHSNNTRFTNDVLAIEYAVSILEAVC